MHESKELSAIELIAEECIRYAGCSDHPIALTWDDVAEVLHAWGTPESQASFGETSSCCVVKLKNGKYAAVWEWGDTTGHGCQCDGGASVWETYDEVLSLGLDANQRQKVLASLADEAFNPGSLKLGREQKET